MAEMKIVGVDANLKRLIKSQAGLLGYSLSEYVIYMLDNGRRPMKPKERKAASGAGGKGGAK